MIGLNEKQYEIIRDNFDSIDKCGRPKDSGLVNLLASNSFIVPYELDEREREHQKYINEINSEDHSILIIAPTMRCNFSCSYCFERDARSGDMNETTQRQLIDFMSERAKRCRTIDVEWFGGEPLLAFGMIENLSRAFQTICRKREVVYKASIVTNGSLLTPRIISQLHKLNIATFHMTLDGTPETFAQRKGISLSRSRALYRRFFTFIPKILEQVESLVIRINIDRDNCEEAYYVVRRLKDLSLTDTKIDIRLALLGTKKNIIDYIPHSCLSREEYASVDLKFKRFLAQEGFTVYGFLMPIRYPCISVKRYSCAIDPFGNLYKCIPEIGRKSSAFANLSDLSSLARMHADTMDSYFDPWADELCKDCTLVPVCLGECPRRHKYEAPFKCTKKFKLAEKLLFWEEYFRENPLASRMSSYRTNGRS